MNTHVDHAPFCSAPTALAVAAEVSGGDLVTAPSSSKQARRLLSVERRRGVGYFLVVISVCLITWTEWVWQPLSFTFDPNDERCLPDFHAGLLLRGGLQSLHRGDLVYWRPSGPLSYVKQGFVLKEVGAVPGDHVQVQGERVLVNGRELAHGLPLHNIYKKSVHDLQRDEIVPPGKIFVYGTHARSDDSRYWGYVETSTLLGRGYRFW
jgi:conjugal transfer pilin signal peptidase TrbI